MTIISLRNIAKHYDRAGEKVEVLKDINFDVAAGEFVALMGPSGSGKSTMLNLIGGLDKPSAGEVWVGNERIDSLNSTLTSRWRARHVGFVFQACHLLPNADGA